MGEVHLREFRDRFGLQISEEQLKEVPFLRFPEDSAEARYLRERRGSLGGFVPARRQKFSEPLQIPPLSAFDAQLKSTESRTISTTMAFVRILNTLMRDKGIGKRIVPIVPDESRTFGMEGMFRQFGIYSQVGQLYRPEDANQLMWHCHVERAWTRSLIRANGDVASRPASGACLLSPDPKRLGARASIIASCHQVAARAEVTIDNTVG
jgi:pyruvate dehydrogenase E1 component